MRRQLERLGLGSNGFAHVRTFVYSAGITSSFGGKSFFNLLALPEHFTVVVDSELVRGSAPYCGRRSTPLTFDFGHEDLRHCDP